MGRAHCWAWSLPLSPHEVTTRRSRTLRLARSGTFRGRYFPGACMAPGVLQYGWWGVGRSGFGRKPFRGLPG
eukprot:6206780-Prymnesium_polylepis.1